MDALVARQPIFDLQQRVRGYELLYRASSTATNSAGLDDSLRTASTIVSSLIDIGLPTLVGDSDAWINFPEDRLISDDWLLLDPARSVIEVVETVRVTPDTVAALQRLREHGYRIALDDFPPDGSHEALLPFAHVVKLDVLGRDPAALAPLVASLKARQLRVLAERVETAAQFEAARLAGFELFQGFHFARPESMVRRRHSPVVATVARVMNLVGNLDASERDIEAAFQSDASLMLRLLRIANAAAIGGVGVESVRQAVALVGRATLHRWLVLLMATDAPTTTGMDKERLRMALERARMAELVAVSMRKPALAPSAFLAGLLSMFDVLLGIPMVELLASVHVGAEVRKVLLRREGMLAGPLLLAEHVERGAWDAAFAEAITLDVPEESLRAASREAVRWAREVGRSL